MRDVERRFELTGRWDGNRYTFSRAGLDGVAVVEPGRVTVELDLGFLLSPLKGRIKSEIESRLAEGLP
jgi:putative polyhydroxyalkanoate system protein